MNDRIDFITRKFAFIYLKFSEWIINGIVFGYSIIYAKKKTDEIKKIGAYWYYPPDLTGSNLRFGGWKDLFENDGYIFENLYINKLNEYVKNIERGNWTSRYLYFAKSAWRRLPQMLRAHNYDTMWIDRAIIPYYPRKTAFLEKRLKKVVSKMVIDTTDGGDYSGNPALMESILSAADEITVGYKHLKEFYCDRFKVTQVFWTIPTENYQVKTNYSLNNPPIIGWMGSPSNFQYVRELIPQLQELAKERDFIFKYICRENFDNELSGIKTEHNFFGEDYYTILGDFDIGLSPFLIENLQTKGKIAMKHQEFLLMGIPQICSPVAISEFVEDNIHVVIAKEKSEWKELIGTLLNDSHKRAFIGANSKSLFASFYTFPSQYHKIKKVLVSNE